LQITANPGVVDTGRFYGLPPSPNPKGLIENLLFIMNGSEIKKKAKKHN